MYLLMKKMVTLIIDELDFNIAEDDKKDKVIGEIFTSLTQEPDQFDFVRINLGDVPKLMI